MATVILKGHHRTPLPQINHQKLTIDSTASCPAQDLRGFEPKKGARPYALPLRGGRKDVLRKVSANYVPYFV
ncbi:MAG: hypothetical protein HF981_09360 [Desulfobacteraceae bacterium]|nr:hypothetical protein [Desulfobacteraceae bacterium]MBC2750579.1 hypothetical protein [Desulfobacteraceae bacterium]